MIARLHPTEWLVEPSNTDDREYARLHVSANRYGLNIDGQGEISWVELQAAYVTLEEQYRHRN